MNRTFDNRSCFRVLTVRNAVIAAFLLAVLLLVPAGQVLYVGYTDPPANARRGNLALEEVSPEFQRCVWVGEDYRFFQHRGFDWTEIRRAREDAARTGRRPRGASTITQQCARSIFLWQGRSWVRKGLEAYYTFWMERLLPKERIFELYVNAIEFGEGIYGIEAAARHYYDVPAGDLSLDQAASLAAIMPNPTEWNPVEPNREALHRKTRILHRAGKAISHLTPDHSGSKLAFTRWANFGLHLSVIDLESLERTDMFTSHDVNDIFGWSGDDRYLLFLERNLVPRQSWISLWDSEEGRVSRLTANENVLESSFTWLSGDTYFFLSRPAEGEGDWRTYWGNLTENVIKGAPIYVRPDEFTAISSRKAVFTYEANLYVFEVAPEASESDEPPPEIRPITEFDEEAFDSLGELRYNKEKGQYLFSARSKDTFQRHLFRYDPDEDTVKRLTDEAASVGRFLRRGQGFAYLGKQGEGRYLAVRPGDREEDVDLFTDGNAVNYTVSPDGNRLYIYGAEAPRERKQVWEYDLSTQVLRKISKGPG